MFSAIIRARSTLVVHFMEYFFSSSTWMTFFVNSLLRFPPVEEIMEPLQDVKITVNTGTTKIMILLVLGAGRISQPSAELFCSCPGKKTFTTFFAIFTNFLGPASNILKGMSDVHLSWYEFECQRSSWELHKGKIELNKVHVSSYFVLTLEQFNLYVR